MPSPMVPQTIVPSWSGDGKSIYFASSRTGSRQIWKHSLENGSERQLIERGGFNPLECGSGTGDPLNPPLIGTATGSLLPLGNIIWSDMVFPNLARGAGDGTFKMTLIDGDTLFGTLHNQGDFSTFPIVPFTQHLTVTGGTGVLVLYHGTLNGLLISDQTNGMFTSSGAGTLDTVPEPESVVLFGTGLLCLLAHQKRALLFR